MTPSLEDLTQQALDAARKAGADAADSVAIRSDGISMEIRSGALEQAERAESTDIGLRVLVGKRQACVAISDLRAEGIAIPA